MRRSASHGYSLLFQWHLDVAELNDTFSCALSLLERTGSTVCITHVILAGVLVHAIHRCIMTHFRRQYHPCRCHHYQACLFIAHLICFEARTRDDQKLSLGLTLLTFMTVHIFRFPSAVTVQYWHPSWLFTLTFFRTPAHGVGPEGPRGLSEPVAVVPFMQQEIWILHSVSSSSVYQLRSAPTSLSRFPAAVGQFTVPNDGSGILSVISIALFGSKAVRATGPLLLSFAGGDTASPAGPSHSDAPWAAVQHGISAALALAPWQFPGEGADEGASRLCTLLRRILLSSLRPLISR